MRLHAEELPQVPRPDTAGSVSDVVGDQRMTAVLVETLNTRRSTSWRLCTIPSRNLLDFSVMLLSPERSRHRYAHPALKRCQPGVSQ